MKTKYLRTLFALVAAFAFYATASAEPFDLTKVSPVISHTDKECENLGSITISFTLPDGMEGPNVSVGYDGPDGESAGNTFAVTPGARNYSVTFNNLNEGDYQLWYQAKGGQKKENLQKVTVKEVTHTYKQPVLEEVKDDRVAPTCTKKGSYTFKVRGGTGFGPFEFSATDKNSGATIKTERKTSANDRTFTFPVEANQVITVTVKDLYQSACKNDILTATEEVTATVYEVNIKGEPGIYAVEKKGKKGEFDYYIKLSYSNSDNPTEQALINDVVAKLKSATDMAPSITIDNGGDTATFSTAYDQEMSSGSTLVYKINGTPNLKQRYWWKKDITSKITLKTECGVKFKAEDGNLWSVYLGDLLYVRSVSNTDVSDCDNPKVEMKIEYTINRNGANRVFYALTNGQRLRLEKKDGNGEFKPVSPQGDYYYTSKPLDNGPIVTTGTSTVNKVTIDVTQWGAGTYRLVYDSGDERVNVVKTVEIKNPTNPVIDAEFGQTGIIPFYTLHGNTSALQVVLSNQTKGPYTVIIEPTDSTITTRTSTITDFLSDKPYEHTWTFPIEHQFKHFYQYGIVTDLPPLPEIEGKKNYRVTVIDGCGNASDPVEFNILDRKEDLQAYKPKQDEGYKDGVYIGMNCAAGNEVRFDFGVRHAKGNSINFWIDTKPRPNPDDGHLDGRAYFGYHNGITTGDEHFKRTGLNLNQEGYYSFALGHTVSASYYDNIGHTYVTSLGVSSYNVVDDEEMNYGTAAEENMFKETHYQHVVTVNMDNSKPENKFVFHATQCEKNNDQSGIVYIGIKSGVNPAMPVTYKLYNTDESGEKTGGAIREITIDKTSETNPNAHVAWTGLSRGKYFAEVTTGTCPPQGYYLVVQPTDIPDPVPGVVNVRIKRSMSPVKVELPVPTDLYDVRWYDVTTDGDNRTPLNAESSNEIYASFKKPGVYRYKAGATFTDLAAVCEGSSAGERYVTFNVTEVPNLWVGAVDDDFSNSANWTVGVPAGGEDIVFATTANNPSVSGESLSGREAERDCRLTSGGKPIAFTAGNLVNETSKAMVIPAGAGLKVTKGVAGFTQETPEAPRLIIKAGSGKQANGTFIAPKGSAVFAKVEMNVIASRNPDSEPWVDSYPNSPTGGVKYDTQWSSQFFGIPFKESGAGQYPGSWLYEYAEENNDGSRHKQFFRKFAGLKKGESMKPFTCYNINVEQPQVMSMTGYLHLGDAGLVLTRRAAAVQGKDGKDVHWGLGENMFANSYTAPIKISTLTLPEQLEKTVFIYNTGSFGDWASKAEGENAQGAGTYISIPLRNAGSISDEIPSMQGFLLKFTSPETVYNKEDVTVSLSYPDVTGDRAAVPQRAKAHGPKVRNSGSVNISLKRGTQVFDTMWLFENESTSDAFDNGWDGTKLGAEMMSDVLYSNTSGGKLQVSTTNNICNADITVKTSTGDHYTLVLKREGLSQYRNLKLVDMKARTVTPFKDDKIEYLFLSQGEVAEKGRFMLMDTESTDFGGCVEAINDIAAELSGPVKVHDLAGNFIMSAEFPKDQKELPVRLPRGVYIISAANGGQSGTCKYIVR